eukprot:COSAG01_NODE_5171_length_4436_cov_4.031128_9_plen_183_part_00
MCQPRAGGGRPSRTMLLPIFVAIVLLAPAARANILWENVCTQADVKSKVWCDTSKSHTTRAQAYVAEISNEEKGGLMSNGAKGVDRLHIPPYQWGSEGLHGPLVCRARPALRHVLSSTPACSRHRCGRGRAAAVRTGQGWHHKVPHELPCALGHGLGVQHHALLPGMPGDSKGDRVVLSSDG